MKCPRCQQDNPPHAKFCLECATPLAPRCANCGTQLPAGAKFCFECATPVSGRASPPRFTSPETYTPRHLAEKILTSRSALEGERKQVTVLFADMKGSMELLADRDPEEARKILDPVLELMMEAVHRYEGTVNQVMGDGIMALFGAPLALEDHAVRACYAALRMQRRATAYADEIQRSGGTPVHIRVGVNSGEVIVRAIGSDLHMDYTAVGQTTHLAARMEQMTKPGSALVTGDTLKLAEGYVQVRSLGAVPVKGLETPVQAYELTGTVPVWSRLRASASRGLSRFVGRDRELEQLGQALERAAAGHGQAVAVVGEAGVGKSRLAWELLRSHRTQDWLVGETGSVSYGKATPYLPVIELLKGYCRIQERDDPRAIRERVAGKVLMLDRALEPLLPPLLSLLDIPVEDAAWAALDPPQRRQRTLDAIKRLLLRESQVQPLLLVFEDLQWIDAETQAVLDSLIEGLPTARILLLVTYRPEYQHGWGGKTYYLQLRIDPLAPESADTLLTVLLGEDPTLAPLKQVLIARTQGNPFFLEESVRTLVETRVLTGERGAYRVTKAPGAWHIPATAQAILAARIDRLAPEDKQFLQTAAVIGKDVPFALLQAIADVPEETLRRGLSHLQAAEFLYETSVFPDLVFTFKHAFTHEVAYRSLLQDRRRALHVMIMEVTETLYPDRVTEQVERLAHHAFQGELWDKAVTYLRQAGQKAVGRSALQEARAFLEQAIATLQMLPESSSKSEHSIEVRLELRAVLILLGEIRTALERLQEAEVLAARLGDDVRLGRVRAFMTNIYALLGELAEARTAGDRALASARATGDVEVLVRTVSSLEQAHYFMGDCQRVVGLATENLAVMSTRHPGEGGGVRASVFDQHWLVIGLAELGRFSEAAKHVPELIRLAEKTRHAFTVGLAPWATATLHLLKGDWAEACSFLERSIAVHRDGDVALMLPFEVATLAWVLAQLGNERRAVIQLRAAEELVERESRGQIAGHLGLSCSRLARGCLLLGRVDEAQRLAERVVESVPSQRGFDAYARHILGDIAAHPDRFDAERGEAHYRHALTVAEPRGMRPLVAHCYLGLGQLDRRTGKRREAEKHLTIATTMYREMGMTYWREKAEAELK